MGIRGYLQLGTALRRGGVVVPPPGTNYAGQPIAFDGFGDGTQRSNYLCTFGPVSGSWGRLNCFSVTGDPEGFLPLLPVGILVPPALPLNGELVTVPPGCISVQWAGDQQDFSNPEFGPKPMWNWNNAAPPAGLLPNLPPVTVAAAGSSQLQATPTALTWNILVNGGFAVSGSTPPPGILLPQAATFNGVRVQVANRSGYPISVYPFAGDTIESNTVNTGIVLQNENDAVFYVTNSGLLVMVS